MNRKDYVELIWNGKEQAIKESELPTNKKLITCEEESKDFDTTQNLYIEGDNLDALKLLKKEYQNKIKMIYIDPPYNTGNKFIYADNLSHTDWLNMIYPRLKLARDLLTDDGVIFISIDDNEQANLKKVCDEIFGEGNFVSNIIWERAFAPVNLMKHFSTSHDIIICYAKKIEEAICNGIPRNEENDARYSNPDNDPRGLWSSSDISVGPAIESNIYSITTPSGRIVEPPAGRSGRLSKNAFLERLNDNRIWFGPDGNGVPRIKRFLKELRKHGVTPMTIWKHQDVGHSQGATQSLQRIFDGKKFFDYPKPIELIKRCIQLYSYNSSLILDFFSGSATTAHAVMKLNAEDGGNRKFIMVQLPEVCAETSEAYKAGYKNICEIGKERIRRAGQKIKDESPLTTQNLDVGFRVLKIVDKD